MLSGSHTAKWLQDSIRKYFRGFGLKELLCQTRVFGVKIADPVLDGTWRSLRGILTLRCLINRGSKIFLKLNKRGGGGGGDFKKAVNVGDEWKNRQMFNIDAQS